MSLAAVPRGRLPSCYDGASNNSSRVLVLDACRPVALPNMRVVAARLGGLVQRRGFASTARRLDSYGFVGLGQMVSISMSCLNINMAEQC